MWLATQVIPQLQAPLSLLLGYLGVATVSTLLEANKLARRALVWAQTPLRTFVHEEMSVIGWSDATWACRRDGSSQGGYIIGVANKTFLEQAESPISVISWHSGKLARVARSSNSAELQAAADAEGELSYIRLSLRELLGETIPLQRWQEAAAQIPSVLVLDSRGVYDALARSESACLGLKDNEVRSGGVVAETLFGGNTVWTSLDTFGGAIGRLYDQRERGSSETIRVIETSWLDMAIGI